MARKNAKTAKAQNTEAQNTEVTAENVDAAIDAHEEAAILAGESNEIEVSDPKQALAEANGTAEALAADEAAADEPADDDTNQAPAASSDEDHTPWADLISNVSDKQSQQMVAALATELSDRAAFEKEANPANGNIQKTLSKLAKKQTTPGIVRGMIVSGTDASVINKNEVGSKRRNVYALEKMHDLLYAAATGHMKNAVNRAICASMVALQDTALKFGGDVAKACVSDKVAIGNDYKAHLIRHSVAESTASTQASSTMTALEDLGAVKNTGTAKFPVFVFTDTPIGRRLIEVASRITTAKA